MIKVDDISLAKSILRGAYVDENLIINVEQHPARVLNRNEYRRTLKIFTKSREDRDLLDGL